MKKLTIVAIIAIAASAFVSSCNQAPKANMKNDIDSLSYAFGMAQTQGLREYLVGRMGMDTTYIDEFIKGLNDGVNAGEDKKKAAYYAGVQIGQQVGQQIIPGINHEIFGDDSTKTISTKNFMAGFIQGTVGAKGNMTQEEAQEYVQTNMQAIKAKMAEKLYGENKKAGEKFMAEYAKKEGVNKTESGILYRVLTEGEVKAEMPNDSSNVQVHYVGTLIDGTEFDSSYKRDQPITINMARPGVIQGWAEIVKMMRKGAEWEVVIPQNLAYGDREMGNIKPFSVLVFKMKIVDIK